MLRTHGRAERSLLISLTISKVISAVLKNVVAKELSSQEVS